MQVWVTLPTGREIDGKYIDENVKSFKKRLKNGRMSGMSLVRL
jgi:hypothetical protein